MSSEPTNTTPNEPNQNKQESTEPRAVDPRDLVSKPGYQTKDPREVIENPAVTPERLDDPPSDLRSDLVAGDDETMVHHKGSESR